MATEGLVTEMEAVEFAGTRTETTELRIDNTSGKRLAFKVKCSDNARFKIRPVMGFLAAGAATMVKLTFFPEKEAGDAPDESHHFSLYQWEPQDDADSARKLWASPEPKKKRYSKRIKVAFSSKDQEEPGLTAVAAVWLAFAAFAATAVFAAFPDLEAYPRIPAFPSWAPGVERLWAEPGDIDFLRPFNASPFA